MKNPIKNRDLNSELRFPKMSWSSFLAFTECDKEEWYEAYVLGIRKPPNLSMDMGKKIGEKLITNKSYLKQVPRPEIFEHKIETKMNGITLLGHMDGWSPSTKTLDEYKTSKNKKRWNQKSVDKWGQLTFYCLLLFLKENIRPGDIMIRLTYIPVEMTIDFEIKRSEDKIQTFETKRTMLDILNFMVEIKKIHKKMEEFIHKKELQDCL